MVKISSIIPVYNGERYLKQCLNSLINQTLGDIEIICVDDGSTDRSLDILNEYAQQDSRIIVIHQENSGVSAARNLGIQNASGEYIHFIDNDDWIDVAMYEKLYNIAAGTNLDMVVCGLVLEWKDSSKTLSLPIVKDKVLSNPEIKEFLFGIFESSKGEGAIWNRIYKREFIQGKIQFESRELVSSEDVMFSILSFIKCKYIYFTQEAYYHYRMRSNSQSRSIMSSKSIETTINMLRYIGHEMEKRINCGDEWIEYVVQRGVYAGAISAIISNRSLSYWKKYSYIKSAIWHPLIRETLKNSFPWTGMSIIRKLFFILTLCGCVHPILWLGQFHVKKGGSNKKHFLNKGVMFE
jgi:glycosyltransferase involved in cell wall biosynthesis